MQNHHHCGKAATLVLIQISTKGGKGLPYVFTYNVKRTNAKKQFVYIM